MKKNIIVFFAIVTAMLFVDLLTKYLTDGHDMSVHNDGIAFGLFGNMRVLFVILNLLLSGCAVVAWWLYIVKKTGIVNDIMNVGFALFICGAIGNLYDRIFFGYVRDFIKMPLFSPIFNVADICLTIGTGILVICYCIASFKKTEKTGNAT
ncbi:MAG: signal peptidase II [Christensenellaceae bacterium]|nr:signal peptidase II [Christensenellaceae bacterium]